MQVDFEILIVLNVAILFTIIVFLSRDYKPRITFSLISAICWMVLGIGFVGANPTYPAYGFLFFGIAMIFVLATIYDTLELLKEKRWSTEMT